MPPSAPTPAPRSAPPAVPALAPRPPAADYRVRLEAFEGPMDLLLYLIRRAEVQISDIPIASITDQYLDHLRHIERIDIELAGEFLVMAATLMEIKSRMLAAGPGSPEAGGSAADPADDPRSELIRQLLAYKQYRDAADELERRKDLWDRRFGVAPAGLDGRVVAALADQADEFELEDLSLVDLVQAFQQIAATVHLDRVGGHEVIYDETPIELHAADLLDRLRGLAAASDPLAGAAAVQLTAADGVPVVALTLQSIFVGRRKGDMIGLFLAMLELIRRRQISARQDHDTGLLLVYARPDAPDPAEPQAEPRPAQSPPTAV